MVFFSPSSSTEKKMLEVKIYLSETLNNLLLVKIWSIQRCMNFKPLRMTATEAPLWFVVKFDAKILPVNSCITGRTIISGGGGGGGRGYHDREENCLHEKNCWNKLSTLEVHLKKIVCRDYPRYVRYEEFKKLSAQLVEKKNCKCSVDGGKNFLAPRNHDTPSRKSNGPSLI